MDLEKTLLDELIPDRVDAETLSLEALLGLEDENKNDREIALLISGAENGNMDAIWTVAVGYMYGKIGFEQDTAEGLYWLTKSDRPLAFFDIADFYYNEGNLEQAVCWIKKADSARIQAFAGRLLADVKAYSLGKNADMEKVGEFLDACVELSECIPDDNSIYLAALIAAMGYHNAEDVRNALKWADFAKGRTFAPDTELDVLLQNYGKILFDTEKYPEYVEQALIFTKSKGEEGHKKAIRILAQYYRYHGDNVTEGLNWIRKAADEAGSAAAAYWMAEAFIGKGGWGIPADLDQCGYYLDLADKSGEFPKSVAALREELDEKLLSASERRFAADDVRAVIHQMEKSGSTVFTIPYGFTHVDGRDRYYDMNKPLSKVTELVLPDTLISIGDWSFEGFVSLTKVNIPRRLKYIGEGAFASKRLGMFNRMVSGKNIIEALTIPLKTELVKYSLGDIPGIRMLRFEEGRTELDWEIFHSLWMTAEIEELHIPDSLTKIHNPDAYVNLNVKILYAPKHLETQINSIQRGKGFTKIGKIIYR